MATKSCHSNQSSYPIGTKNNLIRSPLPINSISEIWQESDSWLQRCHLKLLTTDAWLYSPISLRLRWAKNTPCTPKIGNGLVQLIRMDKSTRQMWVKTGHVACNQLQQWLMFTCPFKVKLLLDEKPFLRMCISYIILLSTVRSAVIKLHK